MNSQAKSRLFEYCSQHQLTSPKFTSWQNQNNKWLATVSCFDKKFDSTNEYSRKKDAENNVAELTLNSRLVETKVEEINDDLPDWVDEDEIKENVESYINSIVKTYTDKFDKPIYWRGWEKPLVDPSTITEQELDTWFHYLLFNQPSEEIDIIGVITGELLCAYTDNDHLPSNASDPYSDLFLRYIAAFKCPEVDHIIFDRYEDPTILWFQRENRPRALLFQMLQSNHPFVYNYQYLFDRNQGHCQKYLMGYSKLASVICEHCGRLECMFDNTTDIEFKDGEACIDHTQREKEVYQKLDFETKKKIYTQQYKYIKAEMVSIDYLEIQETMDEIIDKIKQSKIQLIDE